MKANTVWFTGLLTLAVVSTAGLLLTLPQVEHGIQVDVDKALAAKGVKGVEARVSGQTVTLHATANTADAAANLAQAKAAVATLSTGQGLRHTVTSVQVDPWGGDSAPALTAAASWLKPDNQVASASSTPSISGEKATMIVASADATPPVAGDQAQPASALSPSIVKACENEVAEAIGIRKLSYVQGSYDLTKDSQSILDDVYKVVQTCPGPVKVTVTGYTDNAGDAMANLLISKARAQTAAEGLVARGLPADRVAVQGLGAGSPIADNSTPQGRVQNRRVIIRITAE